MCLPSLWGRKRQREGRDVCLWGHTIGICHPSWVSAAFCSHPCWTKQCPYLCLSSGSRCQLFPCPQFWLHPRALTQCFPIFSLQQPSTELAACYSEQTEVNHCVLSLLPKLGEVAKLGLVCRTFFIPTESPTHRTWGMFCT